MTVDILGTTFCTYCGEWTKIILDYSELGDPRFYDTYCETCGTESGFLRSKINDKNLVLPHRFKKMEL